MLVNSGSKSIFYVLRRVSYRFRSARTLSDYVLKNTPITAILSCCTILNILAPATAASISILAESDTSLIVRFTDNAQNFMTLSLTRSATSQPWLAPVSASPSPGVIFGNPNPAYAGTSFQRSLGISAAQAIQPFSSNIISRTFSDITIIRVTNHALAVCLWQSNRIVEIWYLGEYVHAFITLPPVVPYCLRNKTLCCWQTECNVPTGQFDENGQPIMQTIVMKRPFLEACIKAHECPGLDTDTCACLDAACLQCLQLTVPPECVSCGVTDLSASACMVFQDFDCSNESPNAPPAPPTVVDILLENVGDWLAVRIDAGN